jgi:3-phosphoshikimate 1-carboxyvinyltransferase
MALQRYSTRDEFGNLLPTEQGEAVWAAPVADGPLAARLMLPGSKSLTNRELVLSALADGPSLLRRPLHSRDSALMIEALKQLGVVIDEVPGDGAFGPDLRITPPSDSDGPVEFRGGTSIDTGLAGTVMRFLPPLAALALGPVAIDGDAAARRRPMRTTIRALRDLGVDVDDDGLGTMPFTIHATGAVEGGELAIDASASSQFVSGLLLAAPRFRRGLTLRHTGERLPSMPHIEMTIATLAERGVVVASPEPGVWVVTAGPVAARDVTIEADLSNAAPFLAAALVAGGTVTIDGWPDATTQVGAQLEQLLPRFGARVTRDSGALTVDGGLGVRGGAALPGVDLDLSEAGELAPTLASDRDRPPARTRDRSAGRAARGHRATRRRGDRARRRARDPAAAAPRRDLGSVRGSSDGDQRRPARPGRRGGRGRRHRDDGEDASRVPRAVGRDAARPRRGQRRPDQLAGAVMHAGGGAA